MDTGRSSTCIVKDDVRGPSLWKGQGNAPGVGSSTWCPIDIYSLDEQDLGSFLCFCSEQVRYCLCLPVSGSALMYLDFAFEVSPRCSGFPPHPSFQVKPLLVASRRADGSRGLPAPSKTPLCVQPLPGAPEAVAGTISIFSFIPAKPLRRHQFSKYHVFMCALE